MKKQKQVQKHLQRIDEQVIQHEIKEELRLNKYISSHSHYSRREADRLIEEGRVSVDGIVAQMGTKVKENQIVAIDGNAITKKSDLVYIALNKPIGITCTTDEKVEGNLTTYMHYSDRIFPIGRLDKDSSGLLLLTSDGDIVNKVLRSANAHEKEYIVRVNKNIDDKFLESMRNGVTIYNQVQNRYQKTRKCIVHQQGLKTFSIILNEGMNRQIRRMCIQLGYRVQELKRVRFMNIELNELKVGEWRYLSKEELTCINTLIKDSKSHIE